MIRDCGHGAEPDEDGYRLCEACWAITMAVAYALCSGTKRRPSGWDEDDDD